MATAGYYLNWTVNLRTISNGYKPISATQGYYSSSSSSSRFWIEATPCTTFFSSRSDMYRMNSVFTLSIFFVGLGLGGLYTFVDLGFVVFRLNLLVF